MRSDPDFRQSEEESARIIHLGEVRRRKARQHRAPDRYYLAVIGGVGGLAWLLWLAVVFALPPSRLLTYVAFFAPLAVAVAATGAIVAFVADLRLGYLPSLTVAIRRGALAAGVVTLNLALLAAHHWLLAVGGISIIAAVLADVAIERRLSL